MKKVGDATEYGKVFEGVQIDNTVKTPLNEQLDKLAGMITKISYAIAILVIVGRLILYFTLPAHNINQIDWIDFGHYLLNTAMIAITVVVVAVPEGLPMSVTLSLAYSMRSMMATNNLVRKMHACETMGATTVICTDKTGTLTQNQMTIYETYFNRFTDEQLGEKLIAESMAVNSTAYLDFTDKDQMCWGILPKELSYCGSTAKEPTTCPYAKGVKCLTNSLFLPNASIWLLWCNHLPWANRYYT